MNNEACIFNIFSPQTSKKLFFLIVHFCLFTFACFAVDFSIRPKGFVYIPMGEGNVTVDGNERYSMGGGGELGFEIDLATVWPNPLGLGYTVGLDGAMVINPMLGDDSTNVSFYSGAGALGLYIFPLSRLFFRIDGAAGVYLSARNSGNSPGKSEPGLYWRGGGELGFRFTPGFTIAANGGWRQFMDGYNIIGGGGSGTASGLSLNGKTSKNLVNSGLYAGLTLQLTLQAGSGTGRDGISVSLDQFEDLYPVFMQLYQTNPLGSVYIRNSENAEIRNVRVSFRADGYTASEFPCGEVSIIPRGRRVELPLYADFSPEVLRFTDKGRILGEVVVRYRFLGQEREAVRAVTVATHNRNMVSSVVSDTGDSGGTFSAGSDPSALAAFISPTSPETLDFARFVAGLARANRRVGHNQNMQYAIWLLEALRASNIRFGETYSSINEAQFPAETLLFRTGGSRDLALLFSAGLEGVGISSAFIQTEGDFLVAVNLGINQSAAETLFNGNARILIINDEVWLPLSMSAFNGGFIAAWTQGAVILNQVFAGGREAVFVLVQEAWASYPPAPLPELGGGVIRTEVETAEREVNRAMQTYVTQELNPLIQQVQGAINSELQTQGLITNNAARYNRLAILLARAGRINEAKSNYERAAGMGSVPAMTNRANLALIERDFAAAERWFRQALQREPENRTALRGLERIAGAR